MKFEMYKKENDNFVQKLNIVEESYLWETWNILYEGDRKKEERNKKNRLDFTIKKKK
jgi:hypothetical protein